MNINTCLMSVSQSARTASLLKTPIGNLLSNLDGVTLQEALEGRYTKCPIVLATRPFAKKIQQTLMEYSSFDINTGRFTRILVTQGASKLGLMGKPDSTTGYIRVRVASYLCYNSHLVYLWLIGELPKAGEQIDHIDGNITNDNPLNLRAVKHKLNGRNTKKHCNNTSGYTGVRRVGNKYQARIVVNYQEKHIGHFSTAKAAYEARQVWVATHPEYGFTDRHGL